MTLEQGNTSLFYFVSLKYVYFIKENLKPHVKIFKSPLVTIYAEWPIRTYYSVVEIIQVVYKPTVW